MKTTILVAGLLAMSAAFAQDPASYDGKWRFEFTSDNGYFVAGSLVVQGQTGTWTSNATSKNNPCLGRPTPVTVKTASADSIAFDINGSKVLQGCADNQVQLKRTDATHLEGTINQSTKVKLVRE
jgi:hypothetical protein